LNILFHSGNIMKLRNIALAAAAVVASLSATAATYPTNLATTISNGQYISIAGASAVQSGFEALIAGLLTNPVYYSDAASAATATGVSNGAYLAVSGNLVKAAGTWGAGTQVVVLYRVAGGSYNGVYPVERKIVIDALDVTNCTNTADTTAGTFAKPFTCATRGPNSTPVSAGLAPDAGISDVDPSFFSVTDNLEGEPAHLPNPLSTAEVADLTSSTLYAIAMGIPMTRNISANTVITKPVYSALMTGAFTDWSQVPGSADTGPIVICRRIPGSGTQAVTNWFAGNTACTSQAIPTSDRTASAAYAPAGATVNGVLQANPSYDVTAVAASNGTGLIVIENNSSTDVRKCMDAAYNGGSYTTKDRDSKLAQTVFFGTGGYKAIGVLSTDSLNKSFATATATPTLGNANGFWQFRGLNGTGTITSDAGLTASTAATVIGPVVSTGATGVLPTLSNIQTGDWALQGYESFNIPKRLTGNKLALAQNLVTEAQSAHVLRTVGALANVALSLPDAVTGNVTPAADVSNVLQASYANGSLCGPLQRQY
jgi:ABC-type phosphate transport system substrate-binding protein